MDPQCTQRIPVMSSITGSLPQPAHVVLPSIHRMTGGKEGTQEEPAKQTLPPIHEVLGNNHRFAYSEGPSFSPSLKPGNWENVPPLRVPDMVSLDQRPSFHHELQIQTQKSPPTPSRIMENPQISSIQSFSSNNTIVPTRRPERVPISCTQNLSHNGYFLPHSANSVASSDGFRHFQRLPYGCLSVSRVLSGPPVSSARHYTASGQEVRPSISVAKFKGGQGLARSVSKQRTRKYSPHCHSCNRVETPEWRRGPDGARTLCNACGLHYAKMSRRMSEDVNTKQRSRRGPQRLLLPHKRLDSSVNSLQENNGK